jgi:hypothetical protein
MKISGNAVQHGATARPEPERVATWLRIILDQPSYGLENLLSGDDHVGWSLALAEAEARLSACEHALRTFEDRAQESGEILPDLLVRSMHIVDELKASVPNGPKPRRAQQILERILRADADRITLGGTRHRLLVRYRDEARSHRKHAFQDWSAFQERDDKRAISPKQSQILPEVV